MTDNPLHVSKIYGWKRDLPVHIDNYLQVAHPTVAAKFPPSKYLSSSFLPPIYDQGQLGSCTANALSGAFEFEQKKEGLDDFMPSRLFLYYNERVLEGTVNTDSGAALSDGIKVLTNTGICPESNWPYDITKFSTMPPALDFVYAKTHKILGSKPVPVNIIGFKTMINMGYPVVFGFTVYESFENQQTATTGIMQMPVAGEQVLGGHAIVCVGYSDTMKSHDGKTVGYLKCRNSWGTSWGSPQSPGYFWMPYNYMKAGLLSDAWVITQNEATLVNENKKMAEEVKV
jgi:C1A family cysteine protease